MTGIGIDSFDEEKYQAERLVQEAYMETTEAKKQVERVAGELRESKAETKRKVAHGMKGGPRETYPGSRTK